MIRPILFTSLLITTFCLSLSAQNKSVYTSTKTNACRTIESDPDEAGSYIGECRGVGGYRVQLIEGDIRQTLNIITPSRKKFELNFWALYTGFSAIGEKIEWRTKGGVPVALVARYNVANADDSTKSTSYLMISKIAHRSSCVTDVVTPGPKQNEKARILADAAAGKPCMHK
ncbi:MAG: hypothetical protein ABI878_09015 [Acidobacteriota bacterium]